jgi:hypothetical protein
MQLRLGQRMIGSEPGKAQSPPTLRVERGPEKYGNSTVRRFDNRVGTPWKRDTVLG